jgi:hypothetical protein
MSSAEMTGLTGGRGGIVSHAFDDVEFFVFLRIFDDDFKHEAIT